MPDTLQREPSLTPIVSAPVPSESGYSKIKATMTSSIGHTPCTLSDILFALVVVIRKCSAGHKLGILYVQPATSVARLAAEGCRTTYMSAS
jgi:hypothetical protein